MRLGGHGVSPLGPLSFAPQRRRAVPWGAADVALVICFFLLTQALFAALWRLVNPQFASNTRWVLAAAIQADLLTAVFVPFVLRLTSGARLYQLGLHIGHFGKNVLLGIAAYFVALPFVWVAFLAASFFSRPTRHLIEEVFRADPTLATLGLALSAAVIVAPVAEELLFRGVLLPWLVRLIGRWPAIIVSSLAFAAVHANWPAPIPLFVLALFLGYLADRTSSLVAPIALHATFNGVSMLALVWIVWQSQPVMP